MADKVTWYHIAKFSNGLVYKKKNGTTLWLLATG